MKKSCNKKERERQPKGRRENPKNKRSIQTTNTRQNLSAGDNPEMQEQVKGLSVDQQRSSRLRNI